MTIFRVQHNKNYTCINNHICTDNNLSWKAKGIWLYAFSRPDDWQFKLDDLMKQSTDGRDSLRQGLLELEKFGYLKRFKPRDQTGKFETMQWTFYEVPQNPEPEKLKEILPRTGELSTVKGDQATSDASYIQLSTEEINTEKQQQQTKTTSREAPLFAAVVFEKSTQEKEQQQKCNAQSVAVVDCLKEVKIPECDKVWLSQHYPEPVIANAVAWATHPSTKINQRLQQALKWACRANPEVPKDEVAYLNENQGYALEIERYQSPHSTITALNRCVEFAHKSSQSAPTCIDYDDKKFKEKVKDALMKYGFTKTQQQEK